ncbi:MAG: hypothetical protein RL299_2058 [Pseudomonadota bacterium]|jgi:hypothetical protein
MAHPVTWAGPRPLWSNTQGLGGAPTILRFAHDEFMEELHGLLEQDPGLLAGQVARHETWRSPQGLAEPADLIERVPLPGPIKQARRMTLLGKRKGQSVEVAAPAPQPLKLYQPVHMRHYVVCATLACQRPGFPDRQPEGPHEQVGYVVRRVMKTRNGPAVEHAFLKTPQGGTWQRLAGDDPLQLAPGEERLKLFPLRHRDSSDLRRTLWGAVIPVGRREEYLAGAISTNAPKLIEGQIDAAKPAPPPVRPDSKQARLAEFKQDFSETWKAMIQSALKQAGEIAADRLSEATTEQAQKRLREANHAFQSQSWLLLKDIMAFLDRHLKPVADAVRRGTAGTLSGKSLVLYNWLAGNLAQTERTAAANGFADMGSFPAGEPQYLGSMAAAMKRLDDNDQEMGELLEVAETAYRDHPSERAQWPNFHFLLAGVKSNGSGGAIGFGGWALRLGDLTEPATGGDEIDAATMGPAVPADPTSDAATWFAKVDKLVALVGRALPTGPEEDARPMPFALKLSQTLTKSLDLDPTDPGTFVIRMVHLNADCGPMHPPTLSVPSQEFQLASFFDPDAPARPIRITLPSDTSPAGLRRHAKGTAFVMSNMLCGQVQRAKGLGFIDLVRQVLPWPLHKDIDIGAGGGCKNSGGIDIGMICSISIPIITLCALILLMIIVSLLDFIFRWLPWFVLCFPVPKLKGKVPGAPS